MKKLPTTKNDTRLLLQKHMVDTYQPFHAEMVGATVAGYARKYVTSEHL